MTERNEQPGRGELKKFGLIFGAFFGLVFGLAIPLLRHGSALGSPFGSSGNWPAWPWIVGAVVIGWAVLHPRSLGLLHRPWMKFAQLAQWVNTRIIMLFLFYCIILPIGLLRRLLGKDSMQRSFDDQLQSYRIRHTPQPKDHMEKPY